MAFTDEQKKDIRKYLGVPFGYYDLNTRLESMMNTVGANPTDEAQIVLWLDRLAVIDAALTGTAAGTASVTYGPLKKVDENEFYEPSDSASSGGHNTIGLVEQGHAFIARISRSLGMADVLPYGDYFGGTVGFGFQVQLG